MLSQNQLANAFNASIASVILCQIPVQTYINSGFGSNICHGLFVGWVEHPDIFCWVSFLYPTYLPAIFLLSAKPNKMAEDRTVP